MITKFTAITPENLEMSRLIMSVVSLAMGAEVDVNDNSNNDNLVRPINILNFPSFSRLFDANLFDKSILASAS